MVKLLICNKERFGAVSTCLRALSERRAPPKHLSRWFPLKSLFKPHLEVQEIDDGTSLILARESAVFSNWIPFRRQIEQLELVQRRNLVVDVSDTRLVDYSVIAKLEEMEHDFEQDGLRFEIRGLDSLRPLADNGHAARKGGLARMRRLTVVAEAQLEDWLLDNFVELGATGYTSFPCSGAFRSTLRSV